VHALPLCIGTCWEPPKAERLAIQASLGVRTAAAGPTRTTSDNVKAGSNRRMTSLVWPNKSQVNLGIGAYRDASGKPLVTPLHRSALVCTPSMLAPAPRQSRSSTPLAQVLKCVREAEKKIANDASMDKEYLPVEGLAKFLELTSAVIFGSDSSVINESRVAVCQSLSGTGALRIAAEFIAMYHPSTEGLGFGFRV
jgi:hypothetical protein